MSNFRKILTFRVNDITPEDHKGRLGEITYRDGFLYFHDGNTPGGEIIGGGGSGGGPVSWSSVTGKPSFATVATSGSYADLTNKPTIPSLDGYATEAWVNSQNFGSSNGTTLPANAQGYLVNDGAGNLSWAAGDGTFSGDYNDLINKPSIPTNLSELNNDIDAITLSSIGQLGYATQSYVDSAVADVPGGADIGNFVFSNNKITFPDGTEQTTAYVTAEQKGFFLEFRKENNQAAMQAVTVDADGNTYASYSYYDDNENRRFGGVIKVSSSGSVIWTKIIQSPNSNAEYSQIASLEWANVEGLPVLTAYGYYYDNSTGRDVSFNYFIDPATGDINPAFSLEVNANYGIQLKDGMFGIEDGPMAVLAGESYGVNLVKPLTILSPSTIDRVYISWEDYAASGLNPGDQIYYNVDGWYGMTVNRFDVNASEDGLAVWEGLSIQVTINKVGDSYTYEILGTNGWGWLLNSWGQVNIKVLGSKLGGVDGVNDLTFDFNNTVFQSNSDNLQAAISNIQGTPYSAAVSCIAWNGKDWSTEIGNTLNFDYQLNRQGLLMKIGGTSQWSKSLGGANYEQFKSVVVDSSGNVYAAGYYWKNNKGSLVAKYDYTGAEQWAVLIDPVTDTGNEVTSIDLLSDGNLIVVDENGNVTKLNSSTGDILWQISIDYNNNISWDSDFRGVATPSGDYIFTNYEDDDYTMYVISVSGVDGSIQWAKRITRTWGGNNGEIYPQDDYQAQYIDCGSSNVVIGATTYINFNGNSTYSGLLFSLPLDGADIDGTYEQYVIASAEIDWRTESTTSTPVVVSYQEIDSPTTSPASPNISNVTLTDSKTNIGGGTGGTGDITFEGSKLSSPATFTGNWPNGVITLAPGDVSDSNFANNGQFINVYPTNNYDAPHIHIAPGSGSNSTGSLILGDDNYHIDINNNGSIYVKTNNQNYSWEFDTSGNLRLPYGGDIKDGNGNSVLSAGSLPRAASATNIQNPDVVCGVIRVMMNNGVITVLSSEGSNLSLVYTGRVISATGTQTIIASGATSVEANAQHTLATLVERGDTMIIDNLYDANSGHIYRITVMVTWSSLPHGTAIIERIA